MKATIDKHTLKTALAKIQPLASRKIESPAAGHVLITADAAAGRLLIHATDMSTAFLGEYAASVEKSGKISVPARKLFDIAQNAPEDLLIHEVENRWIEITSGAAEFHIVGMSADDYPAPPDMDETDGVEIDAVGLKDTINAALYVRGPAGDRRQHVQGAFFKIDKSGVEIVSTDGGRLSLARAGISHSETVSPPSISERVIEGISAIIPKDSLSDIVKSLPASGNVSVIIGDGHALVTDGRETIMARLLEGDFPKYEDFLGREQKNILSVRKDALVAMLRRMTILASENYRGIVFNILDDLFTATATNPEIGEATESISVAYQGPAIDVAFNGKFFLDALSVLDADDIHLDIKDAQSPCLISAAGDDRFIGAVMPMKI